MNIQEGIYVGNWNLIYNIQYEVSSIIFMLCMAAYVGIQYNLKSDRNKQFYIMVWIIILATVFDIITAFSVSNVDKIPVEINIMLNTLYFWLDGLLVYQFSCYSASFSGVSAKMTRIYKRIAFVGLIAYTLLLTVNAFTGLIFSFRDGVYQHESLYYLIYIVPYSLFVVGWMIMLFASKRKSLADRISIFLYIGLCIMGLVLQVVFFPTILLTLFTISIATVIILFFLESDDYVEMSKTLAENIELNKTTTIALETKNRFLQNMNDNMSTPIKRIIDYIEVANCGDETVTVSREDLDMVTDLCVSVLRKMDDAIEYSSLEISQFEILENEYCVKNMIDTALMSIKAIARKKEIDIDVQYIDVPEKLIGDRARITQVLNKLLVNAVEYTEEGSITVRINSDRISSKEVWLVISVEDTGIGIEEQQQERIFQAFEKAGDRHIGTNSGLGLGLTFAKELTERMGGKIGLYSKIGEGTLVYMELPQKRAVIVQE